MKMKFVALLGGVLSLGMIGGASAADMAVKARPVAAVVPEFNWSGIYVGGSAGGAWSSYEWTYVNGTSPVRPDLSGFAGGGFVGAQWQWQKLVFGVEANYLWTDLAGQGACPNAAFTCRFESKQHWTVGPRVGIAFSNWLIYGTGGYASVEVKSNTFATATGLPFDSTSAWRGGWFAGGGVEYGITPNWTVGVEYTRVHADAGNDNPTPFFATEVRRLGTDIDTIRGRVSYRFNLGGPAVVAKY